MNTFQHLKRDLIDGARFYLTVDSVTSRVMVEAIRSFQMARDHLRGELLKKGQGFDIGWLYSTPYRYDWSRPLTAQVNGDILTATFDFSEDGEREFSFLVFEILAFFDGGTAWKSKVKDDLIEEIQKSIREIASALDSEKAALERIKEVDVLA